MGQLNASISAVGLFGSRANANFDRNTDVVVVDLSPTGARIEVAVGAIVPKRFILHISRHGRHYTAELVRRTGNEAAVHFQAEAEIQAESAEPVLSTMISKSHLSIAALRQMAGSSRR